jgi:hypothetical protein
MPRLSRATFLALISLTPLVAVLACGTAAAATPTVLPTATPVPVVDIHPSLGQPFDLLITGSAFLDEQGYRLTFVRVVQDSRCPQGTQCPAAGFAVVELAVRPSAGAGETRHELGIGPDSPAPQRKIIGGFEIELQELKPLPGAPAAPATATLVARRSDTRLNIAATVDPVQVPLGGLIEVSTDAGGSGIPQYTLWIQDTPVSTLRYDGSTVSQTPVEGMTITESSADSSGASWLIKMDVAGPFVLKVSVNGEVRIGTDGPFLFAYGEETLNVTVSR